MSTKESALEERQKFSGGPGAQPPSTPAAVTAPQVESKAAPAADITQQATTPTGTMQRKKDPKLITQKSKRKPPQRPWIQKKKAQRVAASAPTNGSLLAALAFPFSGSITSLKSSWQWPSPCSTNSKCRSLRLSSFLSPRVSN